MPDEQELQQQIDALKEQNATLTTDKENLSKALTNERNEHEATTKAAKLNAMTEEERSEYQKLRDAEQKRQQQKAIDAGQIDQLVEQRAGERVKAITKERDKEKQRGDDMELLLDNMVIRDAVNEAVAGLEDVVPAAVKDIILQVQSGDGGNRWVRDGASVKIVNENDVPVPGPGGEGDLTTAQWLEGQREARPHWFVSNEGGGPGPGVGNNGPVPTDKPDPSKWDNKQKLAYIQKYGHPAYMKNVLGIG